MPPLDLQPVLDIQPVGLDLQPVLDVQPIEPAAKSEKYLAMQAEQKALREKDEGGLAQRALGVAENILRPVSNPIGATLRLIEELPRAAFKADPATPYMVDQPLVPADKALKAIEAVTPGTQSEGGTGQAIQEFLAETAGAMTTPDMAATMLAGTKFPVPVGRYFQGEMITQLPESVRQIYEADTGKGKTKAALATAANVAFPALIERGMGRPTITESAKGEPGWLTDQRIGIAPEGTDLAHKAIEALTPRPQGTPPLVQLETGTPAPRLQPYDTLKQIASTPHGAGRIPIIGKLIDPRYSAKTPADEAIIANAFSRQVGDTVASLWFEQAKNRPAPFEKGQPISDLIEGEMRKPGSQNLNPEQSAWINEVWKPLYEKTTAMLKEEGVRGFEVEGGEFASGGAYFPRIAIEKINVPPQKVSTGSASVGGRQFFQKKRLYETELEGSKTTIYEPDANKRVATYLTRVYKAIADTRTANDKSLGGRTVQERYDAIKAERSGALQGLSAKEKRAVQEEWREEARHPLFQKEGTVQQPAFRDVIFPIETANRLNSAFGEQSHKWVKTVNAINTVSKAAQLTLDFSAPLTQGLPMMFRHPVLWGRSTVKSFEALLRPDVLAKELGRPEIHQAASELAQLGVSLRQLQDYMAGAAKGEFLTRIPGYGKAVEATGRAFGAFTDLAKIEMWRAWKETTPKEQWPKLAESIENVLLSGRMESIGLHPGRIIGERLLMMAPAYYRGAAGLVSSLFDSGASGKVTRQAVGSFMTGITATMMGAYIGSGFSREEIENRMNPASSKFLKYPVQLSNGQVMEVSFGGILLSLARLVGNSVEAIIDDRPINTGVEGNLWLRWGRAKLAPVPSFIADATTGRDFMGEEISMKEAVARRAFPIAAQQAIFGKEGKTIAAADAVPSFFGMQAHAETPRQTQMRERNEMARQRFNKSYDEINAGQQAQINREVQKQERFAVRQPESLRKLELATKADFERKQRLLGALSKDNQKKLEQMGLTITSYDPVIRRGGIKYPMSEKQRDDYETAIVAEYNKILSRLGTNTWQSLTPDRKQKLLNAQLLAAKERAKRVLR